MLKRGARPILVTGAHRSGTTWVGKMLAAGPGIAYVQEPFNLCHNRGVCRADFDHWFTYVAAHNARTFDDALRATVDLRYDLAARLSSVSGRRAWAQALAHAASHRWQRTRGYRALIKDPIAVFSAEWLAATYEMDVVIVIRHPAAFAASIKAQHWTHPFSHFVDQPALMQVLAPYAKQIRHFATDQQSILEQAALLWNLIYYVVDQFRQRHPEWVFVRHEDLLQEPLAGFESLYRRLDVRFTPAAKRTIEAYSRTESSVGAAPASIVPRDSRRLSKSWQERLSVDEIAALQERVSGVSQLFYSDSDWA